MKTQRTSIKRILKLGLIIVGVGLLIFLFFQVFDIPSKKDMIVNYNKKNKEIFELKEYFNTIVPDSFQVYIEYKNENKIDFWVHKTEKETPRNGNRWLFQQWNINPYNYKETPKTNHDTSEYSPKTKSLELVKQKLNWNYETFRKIKKMLDRANCISIYSREPTKIGFARRGMGEYEYEIFKSPIPDSLKTKYNDNCEEIYFNKNVVLCWVSGVLGSQCFPDK